MVFLTKWCYLVVITILLGILSYKIFNHIDYSSVKILIVPHQNADVVTRSKLFNKIAKSRSITNKIILIGPDHFSTVGLSIKYSSRDWKIPEGNIIFGNDILSEGFLSKISDADELRQDHAITNLLKDIKINLPNAKFLPILIGTNVKLEDLEDLYDEISVQCGYDCLIINSVDFSHYLPYPSANIHDEYSRYVLESKDFNLANSMEVDSPQTLYLSMRLARQNNYSYNYFAHSNSAELMNNPTAESTGHVLGSYSRPFFF